MIAKQLDALISEFYNTHPAYDLTSDYKLAFRIALEVTGTNTRRFFRDREAEFLEKAGFELYDRKGSQYKVRV